jgi:predicted dehydrogenase
LRVYLYYRIYLLIQYVAIDADLRRIPEAKTMTKSNPLRVGLIGAAGRWGPRAHVPALKGLAETELYAVCTAHANTAQAAADKFGVNRAYDNDTALDADPEVEAVLVAVRVPAHYELTKNAIEVGKHVYCEWPLGANTKYTPIMK